MAEQPLHPHWVSEASFPSFCDGEGNKKANGEGVEENKREENLIAPRPVLFSFIFFLGWTVRICGVREKTSPIHCQQTGPGPSGCVRVGTGQDRPINLARDGLMKENEKKKHNSAPNEQSIFWHMYNHPESFRRGGYRVARVR